MGVKLAMVIYATKHDMHNLRLFLVSTDVTHKNNQRCVFVHLDYSSRIFFVVLLRKNTSVLNKMKPSFFSSVLPIQQRTKNWKNREKQDYFLFSKRNTVLEIASKFKISKLVSDKTFSIFWLRGNKYHINLVKKSNRISKTYFINQKELV